MTSAALVGSTGLVGSHILSTLLSHPSITTVHALSRRAPTTTSPKLTALTSPDSADWPSKLSSITPTPSIFLSALGTTRSQAGSVAAQRTIDLDLNLSLARAAKESGVKVYVLISTSGASATSSMAYPQMKGELEDSVKALGFESTVILRPGLLVGDREDSRPAEWAIRKVAGLAGMLGNGAKDFWAQDAEVVARAAVNAGLQALEGRKGVWELGQADVVRLGRTEWKV